ncbi:MAG: hypothetical protein ACRCT1_04610 [Microcoleaceae cyanobacterium]
MKEEGRGKKEEGRRIKQEFQWDGKKPGILGGLTTLTQRHKGGTQKNTITLFFLFPLCPNRPLCFIKKRVSPTKIWGE